MQKYTGGNLWQGDHVELWFDTQLQLDFNSESDSEDDFQLGISPGNDKDVPADFFFFTPDIPLEKYADQVVWKVVSNSAGYTVETSIPVKVLKGLRVGELQTIGVTFEPSDTDTPDSSEQELMMSSAPLSSSNWGNPTYWNNLTLLAEGETTLPAPSNARKIMRKSFWISLTCILGLAACAPARRPISSPNRRGTVEMSTYKY